MQNSSYDLCDSYDFIPDFSDYHPPSYTSDPFWSKSPPWFSWNAPTQRELSVHKSEFIEKQKQAYTKTLREEKRTYEQQGEFSRESTPPLLQQIEPFYTPRIHPRIVKSLELPAPPRRIRERKSSV